MKKTYIIPAMTTVFMNTVSPVLLNTSETTVSGANGGWTKENNNSWGNIWEE